VLCAEETPTNAISKNTDEHGKPVPGSPHALTVRTPDARLVWYTPIGSRSKTALACLGMLEGYTGYLVPRRLRRLAPVRHPTRRRPAMRSSVGSPRKQLLDVCRAEAIPGSDREDHD
jgi:hypothetical protein